MKKLLDLNLLARTILIIAVIATFFSTPARGQTTPLPEDHPISIAAPNLPTVIRYDGAGKEFYGEKYVYNREENINNLKSWMENYPNEVQSYKIAISEYFEVTETSVMTESEKEIWHDLKFQWMMVIQM